MCLCANVLLFDITPDENHTGYLSATLLLMTGFPANFFPQKKISFLKTGPILFMSLSISFFHIWLMYESIWVKNLVWFARA